MVSAPGITTVIFDVFQTLVRNDAGLWKDTFAQICRTQRLAVDVEMLWTTWRAAESTFRQGRVNLARPEESPPFRTYYDAWRDAFQHAFTDLSLPGNAQDAARRCIQAMARRPVFMDSLPALERLRQRGFRLAVLSNSDDASLYPLVRRLGLVLEAVLSSETIRVYKPHPLAFRAVLQVLDVNAGLALYVGDSLLDDVHGAKLAGMRAAWINRNGAPRDKELLPPDFEITALGQLEAVLTPTGGQAGL